VNCLTSSQLHPPVRAERSGWKVLRSIYRSGRFWPTLAALALVSLALKPIWFKGHKHSPSVKPASQEALIVPATTAPIQLREVIDSFRPNQTITEALAQHGLSDSLIKEIVDCARPAYNLAKVKTRQLYSLCMTPEGKFRDFHYALDDKRYLTVYHDRTRDRLVSEVKDIKYDTQVESVSAQIDSSLFASIERIGEKDQLALDIAEIFSSDIDFNTDIQKGDSFHALVEKRYLNDELIGYGAILATSFSNKQKTFMGFRFDDENGKNAYYGPDGKSLKKSFLKSPLKFSRISSKFSNSRMHPVLRIVRPHLGVDYAAPAGTPVHAVGTGTVTSAGWNGGSGRMVKLRHSGGYETMYLHLSRIAVKSGSRVSQGEVIGSVGSSGLSTGPHLDFRVYRHGKAINPLKVVSPPGAPIPSAQFDQFVAVRDSLLAQLRITNDELRVRTELQAKK
jgi:murein DD-endopeptidase MepM/ murein hydrolase activator NlpD